MITVRKSRDRGHFDHGWLDTYHTFSFSRYYDPRFMGFRDLRVINEDVVAPGRGFGQHPHDNMEIVTYVLSGRLAHRDTLGHTETLSHGEVQRMSAGTGLEHSEFNASRTDPVHLLQIWVQPAREDTKPGYEQKAFPAEGRAGKLQLLVSPDGADGSLTIGQDIRLYATELAAGQSVGLDLSPGRAAWVQVAKGSVTLNATPLAKGDGAAVMDEASLTLAATEPAEVLVFDLN